MPNGHKTLMRNTALKCTIGKQYFKKKKRGGGTCAINNTKISSSIKCLNSQLNISFNFFLGSGNKLLYVEYNL